MADTFETAKPDLAPTLAVSSMEPEQYRPTLLDLPISIFRTRLDNLPEGVTTLRRIVSREPNRPVIEAIRAEPDKNRQKAQKDRLRAFSSVSLLHHRKKDTPFAERLASQWPMLAGDVDKGDNPGIDMAELKAKISELRYALLCGYSVRGGLWFVVRLPDCQTPDTLAGHFRYLQRLFSEQFGVTLDSSKGGNPTDLRFVSYDAAPYINDDATVMAMTYTPPKPRPRPVRRPDFSGRDEGQLLTRLVRFTEQAGEGNRHTTLIKAATVAGGYVAAGRLDEQTAIYGLETVASEWPSFIKSQKTIRDGIRYGQQKPLYAQNWIDDNQPPAQSARPTYHLPEPVRRSDGTAEKWGTPPAGLPPAEVVPLPRPNDTMILNGQIIHGELLPEQPATDLPASWETPGAKPATSATAFHQWQQQHKYFGRHGVASLRPQQPPG